MSEPELTDQELYSIRCYEGGLVHRLLAEHAALKAKVAKMEADWKAIANLGAELRKGES